MTPEWDRQIREIHDTLAVTAAIQQQQAANLKAHAEWLASHDKAMNDLREAGRMTDERIDRLVVAIGQFISTVKPPA